MLANDRGVNHSVASSVSTSREAQMRHSLVILTALLLIAVGAFTTSPALAMSVSLSTGASICAKHGGQNSCGVGGKSKCCFWCQGGHCVDVTCNDTDCWVQVFRKAPGGGSTTGVVGTQPSVQAPACAAPAGSARALFCPVAPPAPSHARR